MNRRNFIQLIVAGITAVLTWVGLRRPEEMELLVAEKIDSQGDWFTLESVRHAAENAKLPLPIYLDFRHDLPVGGRITRLRMDGNRLMATVEFKGPNQPGNTELAIEGIVDALPKIYPKIRIQGTLRGIRSFSISGASLTARKVR